MITCAGTDARHGPPTSEGVLSLEVRMRTQTWVHTATLNSPTRVVIDVGH